MSLSRILGVWCALAALMSVNGIARELLLVPRTTRATADALSALGGVAIILAVTAIGFRPLAGQPVRTLAQTSALLVCLTVLFELVVGRWVDRRSWSQLAEHYALWRGHLWPLVLLALASTPFVWGRVVRR